jgi:iron complex outermembrane recepter protein
VGAWKGWGGFIQFQWKDAYYIDNANFLKAPEYELVNLNFYYNVDLVASTYFKSAIIYFFGGPQRVQLNLPGFRQQQFRQPQSGDRAENPGSVLAVTGTGSILCRRAATLHGRRKVRLPPIAAGRDVTKYLRVT